MAHNQLMTDLEHVIASTALVDTHEHLGDEARYRAATPDILTCLFDGYTVADLVSAYSRVLRQSVSAPDEPLATFTQQPLTLELDR